MGRLGDGERLGEINRHRVHQRMAPDARLARHAVRVQPDLPARTCSARAAEVDAAALPTAVAADRRIARDCHARHLPDRRLHVLSVQDPELGRRKEAEFESVVQDPLLVRDRRGHDLHGRKFGNGIRLRRFGGDGQGGQQRAGPDSAGGCLIHRNEDCSKPESARSNQKADCASLTRRLRFSAAFLRASARNSSSSSAAVASIASSQAQTTVS